MSDQAACRLALSAIVLLSMIVAGYYRFRAGKSGESVSRRDEGRLLFLAIRLSGVLLLVGTLLYLVSPDLMAWAACRRPGGSSRGSGRGGSR